MRQLVTDRGARIAVVGRVVQLGVVRAASGPGGKVDVVHQSLSTRSPWAASCPVARSTGLPILASCRLVSTIARLVFPKSPRAGSSPWSSRATRSDTRLCCGSCRAFNRLLFRLLAHPVRSLILCFMADDQVRRHRLRLVSGGNVRSTNSFPKASPRSQSTQPRTSSSAAALTTPRRYPR